jgi:hypothetical protein
MSDFLRARLCWWVLLICGLTTSGCAGLKTADIHPTAPGVAGQPASQNGWWFVRFEWDWSEDAAPAWHLDLLAAHRILLPAISTYEERMPLWRIHRRAARDGGGHRFSLLFYASRQTARAIYAKIADAAILTELVDDGIVRQVQMKPVSDEIEPDIADTSDPAWSAALRAGWPYYIHGVSRLWLHLVSESADRAIADSAPVTMAETIELYRRVGTEIDDIWQMEGHHALLHHLNAVFGYCPIPIRF